MGAGIDELSVVCLLHDSIRGFTHTLVLYQHTQATRKGELLVGQLHQLRILNLPSTPRADSLFVGARGAVVVEGIDGDLANPAGLSHGIVSTHDKRNAPKTVHYAWNA